MFEIENVVSNIKSLMGKSRNQAMLLENKLEYNGLEWHQLWSSLDCIQDAQCAIDFYRKADYPEDTGGKYLYTYGLLQAFFCSRMLFSIWRKSCWHLNLTGMNTLKS